VRDTLVLVADLRTLRGPAAEGDQECHWGAALRRASASTVFKTSPGMRW
jgi:hypothetical protein